MLAFGVLGPRLRAGLSQEYTGPWDAGLENALVKRVIWFVGLVCLTVASAPWARAEWVPCPTCGGTGALPGPLVGPPGRKVRSLYGCTACGGTRGDPVNGPPGTPGTGRVWRPDSPKQEPPPPPPEDPALQKRLAEARALNAQGAELARKGLWAEAIQRFEQALQNSPDDKAIQGNLQRAREALRLEQEAREAERLRQEQYRRGLNDRIARLLQEISAQAGAGDVPPVRDKGGSTQPADLVRDDAGATGRPDIVREETLPANPQIAKIVKAIHSIQVPPPIPPDQVAIRFGQLAPRDELTKKVILGTQVGVGVLDVAAVLGKQAVPAAKLVIATGKALIAAEDAADVYLVRQGETYEQALRWLKDKEAGPHFAAIVRALRENKPLSEDTPVDMLRAAQAILDPKLGNSGTRIAWDALMSLDARNAALTQACIELGGEVLGQAAGGLTRKILAARQPAFREATGALAAAKAALKEAKDPADRAALQTALRGANGAIAGVYKRQHAPAAGMEHLSSLFTKEEIEKHAETQR